MTTQSTAKPKHCTFRKNLQTHVLSFCACVCLFFGAQTALGQATNASEIISPEPGSTFTSSTVTFVWEDVNALHYILWVGTAAGSNDLHDSALITSTSRMVTGLPTNTVVHVTLGTRMGTGFTFISRYYVYNVDLVDDDDDGIEDSIDPNPGSPDPKVTFTGMQDGENYTLTLLGSGRVASLEIPQTLYDDLLTSPGAPPHMTLLTKMIYNELRDRFEFVIFVSDEDSFPAGLYSGIQGSVQNDTEGIAKAIFDNSATFGSAGRLESAIHLPTKLAIAGGPSLHEIMHRWGNAGYIPTTASSHWGYSNVGGQLGGWADGTLESLGGNLYRANDGRTSSFGTVANGGNAQPYGPLELYLMGLIEAGDVHDIQWAVNPASTGTPGEFTADSIETRTMAQLVIEHGLRVPEPGDAKNIFTALWVVLTPSPLPNNHWALYDRDVYDLSFPGAIGASSLNFWEATDGLGQLKSDGLLEAAKTFLPAVVSISDFFIQDTNAVAQFFADSGVIYRLKHSENFQIWQTVGSEVVGNDQVNQITHTNGAAGPQGFYQLEYELDSPAPRAEPAKPALQSDTLKAVEFIECTRHADDPSGHFQCAEKRLQLN